MIEEIKIRNHSPEVDDEWDTNGHAKKACDHLGNWIKEQVSYVKLKNLAGAKNEGIKDHGMTHLIIVEIEGTEKIALMYAHWYKQPPLDGLWREGLGARTPVVEGDLLYGRGSADDGYGTYAAVLAVKACQKRQVPHPKIVRALPRCE